MRPITRARFGVLACAVALALSSVDVAHAQQAEPEPASLTDAQKASLKYLKEALAVVNTGDSAAIASYLKANSVRKSFAVPPGQPPRSYADMVIQSGILAYRRSRGLELLRVTTEPSRGDVVGIVRNRLTGDEEVFAARVDPQAPYHITGISIGTMAYEPKVMATFGLKRAASVAVTEEERLQEIGSHLEQLANDDIFSGAVVIAREGKPVFAHAYGYANREKKIPNTVDTPFLLASLIKPFTGLAIGQLVEQGKLSYDDPLSKFLPGYPDRESAGKIKVKHLLSHTSGLGGDFFGPDWARSLDTVSSIQGFIDVVDRKSAAFEPGTKWQYNNLGFVLLGRIVEIVSGQNYYEYMQEHVFAPAGATSASFPLMPKGGVAAVPMAYPYEGEFDFENHRVDFPNQFGKEGLRGSSAGGGVASALDILKLSNAIKAGRIVKPDTFALHTSPKPELGATGYGTGYGYGFFPTKSGRPFVGHGGNMTGVCTEFGELKDTPYTLVILSNVTIHTCIDVSQRILRVLRPTTFTARAPGKPGTTPDTPAGRGLKAFVESFNAGGDERKTWFTTRTTLSDEVVNNALKADATRRVEQGAMTIVRVLPATTATSITATLHHATTGALMHLLLEAAADAPHKVTNLRMRPALAEEIAPDFSGSWRIDPTRSDKFSGGAPPETITTEGSRMTVTRTRAGNTDRFVYMLDGTPSKNIVGPAGQQLELLYISKWEGTVLVTTIAYPHNFTRIEKRSIQADGTMKNEVTFNHADGKTETGWMVFNRSK